MIATTRGLVVLTAIAVLLGIVLVASGPRTHGPVARSLVGDLDPKRVTELVFVRPGHFDVRLSPGPHGWQWAEPPGLAEPETVDALFAALRGAKWHRRAARSVAGPSRGELRIVGPHTLTITIGNELPAAGQSWIAIGDHALLVDSWVATALLPEPVALRMRRPLAGALGARTFIAGPLRIEGHRLVKPHTVWLEPSLVEALVDALANLEIVGLPLTTPGPPQQQIFFDGPAAGEVARIGACAGDRVLVRTKAGDGCVERASWEPITAALAALGRPPEQIADRRPLPFTPAELTLADGTLLDLTGRARVGDEDADPERVTELLAALSAAADVVPRPTGKPTATLVAHDRDSTELALELHGGIIVRRGEPLGLRPTREAWTTITRPASALRDPVLWHEDATTISTITVGRVTFDRGAVLGEWTRAPAGAVDPALVDALASSLATVRAPSLTTPPPPLALPVTVTFTPPAGKPTTHKLALSTPAADGCAARVDSALVRVDLALCTAAHALAAQ